MYVCTYLCRGPRDLSFLWRRCAARSSLFRSLRWSAISASIHSLTLEYCLFLTEICRQAGRQAGRQVHSFIWTTRVSSAGRYTVCAGFSPTGGLTKDCPLDSRRQLEPVDHKKMLDHQEAIYSLLTPEAGGAPTCSSSWPAPTCSRAASAPSATYVHVYMCVIITFASRKFEKETQSWRSVHLSNICLSTLRHNLTLTEEQNVSFTRLDTPA